MMLVYLAGPIAGTNDQQANDWRQRVRTVLDARGIGVLDPMARDFRGKEIENVADIVEGDKRDIEQSDVVVANCWQTSVGTSMEIIYAWERRKPVLVIVPEGKPVSPWYRYHAAKVLTDVNEAISWLLAHELYEKEVKPVIAEAMVDMQ